MAAARRAAAGRAGDGDEARDVLAAEEFGVPAADPGLHREEAYDVLAAEEFGVPAPVPGLRGEEAHDVLAAEEFAVPAPSLHSGPVLLPDDPTGIPEPHDVLAAEEFAMPAPPPPSSPARAEGERPRAPRAGVVVLGAALVLVTRRALRRR
jgi:hypothetical protein